MNLIEIAENLKDLPDQYLMQEVQQPTGNYPAYLVISELGRRKRMRDSAMKEMPKTTVAQDLTEPQRQQAMAQMAQMMQAQDQNMIQQAGGLNALPQAQQDLAAMDMLSAQPQMPQEVPAMAGGGMVSFRQGGDVIRAFDGLPSSMFPDSVTTEEDIEAYRPRGFGSLFGLMPEGMGSGNVDYQLIQLGYPREQVATMDPATKRFIAQRSSMPAAVTPAAQPTARPTTQPTAQPTGQPPAAAPRTVPDQRTVTSPFGLPSEANLAAAERAGIEAYKKAMPDRLAEFRADLASQQKGMEARRASNLNEALIAAGLGIMGSKSPRALQAIGEGGMSGLNAYRQGIKDLRDSENALRESRLAMAKAQMLEDQGSFKAGKDARAESISLAKTAADLRNTESAINVREQMAPAQIGALNAQAAAYGLRGAPKPPTNDEFINARISLSGRGIKPPYSPEQLNEEVMRLRGVKVENSASTLSGDYSTLVGN